MLPNVLLVVFDAARADAFEPYGGQPGSTPAVAELARRGSAHPSMHATASWTVPSHAAMFSGMLPRATGLMQAPEGTPHSCRPRMEGLRERLLPEVLRRNDYSTGAVSTNLWLREASGFDIGFGEFVSVKSRRQPGMDGGRLRDRLRWDIDALRARSDDGAAEAGRVLGERLARPTDKPFFWFVNLIECHSPYLPPLPFNDLGPLERMRAAEEARTHLTMDAIWRVCAGGWDIPAAALERMRRLYLASIRALDGWLAGVLEMLEQAGTLDDTIVIVTADHGENLGEGGLLGHAFSLDDRLIRVPFVSAGPVALEPRRVASLAQLPELIAAAIGLDEHPWVDGTPAGDVAVAQFDPPTGPDDPRLLAAIESWGLGDEALERIGSELTCATDGHHKLVRRGNREQLFDLDADPRELSPVAPGDWPEIGNLRAALADPAALPRPVALAGSAGIGRDGADGPDADELRDLEERMRQLGYL